MKATILKEITFCFWWDPANMKVDHFDEAAKEGGRVSYFWAFIRLMICE